MDEIEMKNTFYEVAKMKAQFELLKQAIINNLGLNYTGDELTIKDDRVIVEVMYLIENDQMENLFSFEKEKKEKMLEELQKKQEETNNG